MSELTPTEQAQYHAYASAYESGQHRAAEVRVATQVEWVAWEQTVKDTVGVLPGARVSAVIAAYVALQRAELREWERLTGGKNE